MPTKRNSNGPRRRAALKAACLLAAAAIAPACRTRTFGEARAWDRVENREAAIARIEEIVVRNVGAVKAGADAGAVRGVASDFARRIVLEDELPRADESRRVSPPGADTLEDHYLAYTRQGGESEKLAFEAAVITLFATHTNLEAWLAGGTVALRLLDE